MVLSSVFTPTHDPAWLADLWASLRAQTTPHWEWVVLANGPNAAAVAAYARQLTAGDPRAAVHLAGRGPGGVGAAKREAADRCRGGLLVEADHDDRLAPDCLGRLAAAAAAGPELNFLYSDCWTVDAAGRGVAFDPALGWESYPAPLDGRPEPVNRTPAASARSLCELPFCPDHVRAWTRPAYALAGGHDPAFPVADDHDLIGRTYLRGVPFTKLDAPLYVRRWGPHNTSKVDGRRLDTLSRQVKDRDLFALAREWCRREGLGAFFLGRPGEGPPGVEGVHRPDADPAAELAALLARPEAAPGRLGAVWLTDYLHRLPAAAAAAALDALWDRLAPLGWVFTSTPAASDAAGGLGWGAVQDPDAKSLWVPNSFWPYTDAQFARRRPGGRARFQLVRTKLDHPSDWHRTHRVPYVHAHLCAVRDGPGGRPPGEVRI